MERFGGGASGHDAGTTGITASGGWRLRGKNTFLDFFLDGKKHTQFYIIQRLMISKA